MTPLGGFFFVGFYALDEGPPIDIAGGVAFWPQRTPRTQRTFIYRDVQDGQDLGMGLGDGRGGSLRAAEPQRKRPC